MNRHIANFILPFIADTRGIKYVNRVFYDFAITNLRQDVALVTHLARNGALNDCELFRDLIRKHAIKFAIAADAAQRASICNYAIEFLIGTTCPAIVKFLAHNATIEQCGKFMALITEHSDNFLVGAAEAGRYDLCRYISSKFPNICGTDYSRAITMAEERRFYTISNADFMHRNALEPMNAILIGASHAGDLTRCGYAMRNGADDFDKMMIRAAFMNHPEICKLARGLGVHPTAVLYAGVFLNDMQMCESVINTVKGPCNINDMLFAAATCGNIEMFTTAIKLGADRFDETLYDSAYNNHIEICRIAIAHGASDFNSILYGAVDSDNFEVCQFALEAGASDVDYIAEHAREYQDTLLLELAKAHGAT